MPNTARARYDADSPSKARSDYLYGANWSLWLDVKILLRTVPFVLGRRGL